MEQFFGFYTYPAFWIKPLITPYEDLNSYRNHIYKLKLRYDSIKYSIIIFNDGLVGIKIKGIELPETENDSLKATFILWQEYNKMSLLIMAILSEYININNINTYVAIEEIQAKDYGIIYIEDNEIKRYSYIALCYFTQIFCKRRLFENYCPELDVIHEQTLAAKNLLPETIIQYLGNKIDAIFSTDASSSLKCER